MKGTVLTSRVVDRGNQQHGPSYDSEVKYEYEVGGVRYQSDRIHFGYTSKSKRAATKMSGQYYKGQHVIVSYDPKNPSESVLECIVSMMTFFYLVVLLLMFVIGLTLFGFGVDLIFQSP